LLMVGLLVALSLVYYATSLQAGNGSSLAEMLHAQRITPLLWLVDGCGVGILCVMGVFGTMLNHFQDYITHQSLEYQDQLAAMIEHTTQIEDSSNMYADRMEELTQKQKEDAARIAALEAELNQKQRDYQDQVSTLEAAGIARREVFETDSRLIAQEALL